MAAIDKIYLNEDNYYLYIKWIKNNTYTKNSIRKVLNNGCYKTGDNDPFAICNYSTTIDCWLAKNCPFGFILNRLCEQYNCNLNEINDRLKINEL